MEKHPLAALTMFYNEPDLLPVWLRHYARQAGAEHCYAIDHGSTEGLEAFAAFPRATRFPLQRSPLDEDWRRHVVAEACVELLQRYEYVAHSDIDELLVADPAQAESLTELCRRGLPEVTTAFGCNVLVMEEDKPIDWERSIAAQRRWMRPAGFLCKPALIRRPTCWSPGFHHADAPSVFAGLYLFHVAYVDWGVVKRRQRKRVRTERGVDVGVHHGWSAHDMVWHLREAYVALPRTPLPTLGGPPEAAFAARLLAEGEQLPGGCARVMQELQAETLWELPEAFAHAF